MKKLLTVVFTMLLAGSLSFAQNAPAGDNKDAKKDDAKTATSDKPAEKEKKGGKKHKAKDDKSKKGASDTSTAPAPPK